MSRNYLLLLMFLAGSLGILNSCGDIPDESPNSVKVSLGVSDHAHRSRNLGRWPFRSNAALELSSTDQGVAYLFQTSAFDLTQENVSDPRELAYSYGDYTRTSGLSGSAELTAPIGEEVFVAVGFSDAQGQGIGHFFTQPFTVSSSQTSITTQIDQVFLDNTTSGGDNSTTDNTTSNPPPSGSPPAGVFYTYDDGISLNVATWDNQSANSINLYSPEALDNSSVAVGASCSASDSIVLHDNATNQCISLSLASSGYPMDNASNGMYFNYSTATALQAGQDYALQLSSSILYDNGSAAFPSGKEIAFRLVFKPYAPWPPTESISISGSPPSMVSLGGNSWDSYSLTELYPSIQAQSINPSTVNTSESTTCSGSLQLYDNASNACIGLTLTGTHYPDDSGSYLNIDAFAKQSLVRGNDYALIFTDAIQYDNGSSVFPSGATVNFQAVEFVEY